MKEECFNSWVASSKMAVWLKAKKNKDPRDLKEASNTKDQDSKSPTSSDGKMIDSASQIEKGTK
jgi:hypothetical protein